MKDIDRWNELARDYGRWLDAGSDSGGHAFAQALLGAIGRRLPEDRNAAVLDFAWVAPFLVRVAPFLVWVAPFPGKPIERGRRIIYKATTDSDVVNIVAAEGAKSRRWQRSVVYSGSGTLSVWGVDSLGRESGCLLYSVPLGCL